MLHTDLAFKERLQCGKIYIVYNEQRSESFNIDHGKIGNASNVS